MNTLPIESDSLVANADIIRKVANNNLGEASKIKLAQFMTPASTASFMASLFPQPESSQIELLDPGAGIGILSSAFLSNSEKWKGIDSINLDAFEIDPIMLKFLKSNLDSSADSFCKVSGKFNFRIVDEDFILKASNQIFDYSGLWRKGYKCYTHCIMNPPYKKISSSSVHRKSLRLAGIETVNLYSGFVALALSLLDSGGQLVAIIPRSFCNGPYYQPFREFIFKNASLCHIHLFESRNAAFKHDNVLQENVIIRLKKGGEQGDVRVTLSSDDTFSDIKSSVLDFDQIVHKDDKERFIHIPSVCGEDSSLANTTACACLTDIGLQVSTGPVVDYRLKEHLREIPRSDDVPLLYPCHFSMMETKWPIENGRKPNAISFNEETKKWLYPNGFYTVVRRFSSKEEKRRIVASVVTPTSFESDFIGFENHLNVFHFNKQGVDENLARGLAVYLNCKAVDDTFRRFSGHTQVNATDLRKMKYPDRNTLELLGKWAKMEKDLQIESFDHQLEKIANESVKRKN